MQRQRLVLSGIFGLMAFGALMLVTNSAQAASGNGPYYATPSWDQKLPAATRFVLLTDWNDEAVLDRNTGLVWVRQVDLTTNLTDWFRARSICAGLILGNQMGWRLPSVFELGSLMDPVSGTAGLPIFDTPTPFGYWSATTSAQDPTQAWGVNFQRLTVSTSSKAGGSMGAWCVRGGMTADAY